MNDGLTTLLGLYYAIAAGPSNAGHRADGKICTAQPGECGHNPRYYTPGMRDAKSRSDPSAGEECPDTCPYLSAAPRDMGDEPTRGQRADELISAVKEKQDADKASAAPLLGSLGLDPREYLD